MCYMSLYFVIMCCYVLCMFGSCYPWLMIELWWYMVDGYCDCIVDHARIDGRVYFDVS